MIAGQFKEYTWVDRDCVEAELPDVAVDVTVPENDLVVTDFKLLVDTATAEVEAEVAIEIFMEDVLVVEAV